MPLATDDVATLTDSWKIEDVIDFEFLLAEENGDEDNAPSKTRYNVFQTEVLPKLQARGDTSRRLVFRTWLQAQRKERKLSEEQLPGEQWKAAWQLLVLLSVVAGAGLGGSMTAALLLYQGDLPVNVPWFLACTLGVQLLVLLAAAMFWLMRATIMTDGFRPLRHLLAGVVWRLADWTSSGLQTLPGYKRDHLRKVFANPLRRRDIYGSLATWPFVVVTQIFGVSFNVGILAVLLAQISFKDIEFGWQSSFVESEEVAYRVASAMAVPWKSFAPNPHPTLQEVSDSHFKYKETRSNKSWWSFLCYSIICYGLVVRAGLLVFAALKWRRAMDRLTFDHCPSLFRRLVGPVIRSQGDSTELAVRDGKTVVTERRRAPFGDAFGLIGVDFEVTEKQLADCLADQFGWSLARVYYRVQIDFPSANTELFPAVAEYAARLAGIVVLVPADRPPVEAIAIFLRKLANSAAAQAEIVVLLVGRPASEGFAAVDQVDYRHWQTFVQNLAAIHQLPVTLEKWAGK